MAGGTMLVLEVKGREREEDRTKRRYMEEWCEAVNAHGGFGRWDCAVSWQAGDVHDILAAKARTDALHARREMATAMPPSAVRQTGPRWGGWLGGANRT